MIRHRLIFFILIVSIFSLYNIFFMFQHSDSRSHEESSKSSELKSHQQFEPLNRIELLEKEKYFRKISALGEKNKTKARSISQASDKIPDEYFSYKSTNYSWSDKAFAVPSNLYKSGLGEKIFEFNNMIVFESINRVEGAYGIVKNNRTGEVGYYTNKIIIIQHKSQDILGYFNSRSGLKWSNVGETYIVEIKGVDKALRFLNDLKISVPTAKADIDINTEAVVTK